MRIGPRLFLLVYLSTVGLYGQSGNEISVIKSPNALRGLDFTVTNNREVPLTGFTVKVDRRRLQDHSVATWIYDSLANDGQPALKLNESYTWHLAVAEPDDHGSKPYVNAAIFGDGLAIGETAAIGSLWGRRQWTAVSLKQVFDDLYGLVPNLEDAGYALATLKARMDLQTGAGTAREKRGAILTVYGTVIASYQAILDRRAKGETELASPAMEDLRKWADDRVAAIQSQVEPVQLKSSELLKRGFQ